MEVNKIDAAHRTKPLGCAPGASRSRGRDPQTQQDAVLVYNCLKCPGFCCSYPLIPLEKRDVERLARYHGMEFEEARRAFTREAHGRKYAMKRKRDRHFGAICRFFDTDKRRCTIYHARPAVCRSFPGKGRCGYYDFLSFERRAQDDPNWVAVTTNR
jgi:Fe-S-cluster containining protein